MGLCLCLTLGYTSLRFYQRVNYFYLFIYYGDFAIHKKKNMCKKTSHFKLNNWLCNTNTFNLNVEKW